MRLVQFAQQAIEDMQSFKSGQAKLAFRILELISDIQKHPFEGIGKPEPLKGNHAGKWSRRISEEHRLIYKVTDEAIMVFTCKGHYE